MQLQYDKDVPEDFICISKNIPALSFCARFLIKRARFWIDASTFLKESTKFYQFANSQAKLNLIFFNPGA